MVRIKWNIPRRFSLMHRICVIGEHGRANIDLLGGTFALGPASFALVAALAAIVSTRLWFVIVFVCNVDFK